MSTPRSLEWLLLAAALSGAGAAAQPVADDQAQRQRLAREQAQVLADARVRQAACGKEFAVSACTQRVLAERRASLAALERQRAVLDDAQRKRRAAERLARIEQRQAAAANATVKPALQVKARAARPAPAEPVDAPALPEAATRAQRAASMAAAEDARAAQRAGAAAQREKKAAEHRAAVEQRNRERASQKVPAAALPVPPAAASASMAR
jgi:colicin import membrane protein